MAYLKTQGICMCGAKYEAHIKKPTRFEFTSTKITCSNCHSRFFIQCLRGEDSKKQQFKIDMLYLSKKAERAVKEKLLKESA